MKHLVKIALTLVVAIGLGACGGSDSSSGGDRAINVTGNWKGTYSTSLKPLDDIVFSLNQNGTTVKGTYRTTTTTDQTIRGTGTFTGALEGSAIRFTLLQTSSCPGKFVGIAVPRGPVMQFTYYGNDCEGFHRDGKGEVRRLLE